MEPEDPVSHIIELIVPAFVSWLLVGGQLYVLFQTKAALHRVLATKGCKDCVSMPDFLRRMNAMVTMRTLLPHVPMFEGSGDDFIVEVVEKLTLKFYNANDIVSKKGDMGHSMYFICTGAADVTSASGKVLGSLTQGDYVGEMAILLDQPRTANIVARNRCTIFELERTAMESLSEGYPAAVQRMVDFADARRLAALRGHFDRQQVAENIDEDVVLQHSDRLKEAKKKMQAQREKEETMRASISLKMGMDDVKSLAKNAPGNIIKLAKKTAHTVGLPGTGVAGAHSAHGSDHLDRMDGADEILSHEKNHLHEEISEITMLLNCFCVAYYGLRMFSYTIPNLNGGPGLVGAFFAHLSIIAPCVLVTVFLAPVTTKYSCLLDNVLFKDGDAIAEVYHTMSRLITLKNQIKRQLTKVGKGLACDVGLNDDLMDVRTLAELLFKEIDSSDGNDSGKATYAELRKGLVNFGVYMSRKEYKQMMEFIDPDRDGYVELEEWVGFLSCTDEQLLKDEWQEGKKQAAVRKRLSAEMVRKTVAVEGLFTPNDDEEQIMTVRELTTKIFEHMDSDQNNSLSVSEIENGLKEFGITLTAEDILTIDSFVADQGKNKELNITQWRDFINVCNPCVLV